MKSKGTLSAVTAQGLRIGLSPWLLVGLAVILGLVITALSVKNTQRDRGYMTQNMMDRAEALIWALEAGTRTWMGMHSSNSRLLQPLVEETAKQPGIVFIAVLDERGKVLAHSDRSLVGTAVDAKASPLSGVSGTPAWRVRTLEGKKVFEVYRSFAPFRGNFHAPSHNGSRECCDWHAGRGRPNGSGRHVQSGGIVFVGLDEQPFAEALAKDFRNNVLAAVLIAALGFAGFISLFWAHNYRRSRRLLKDSRAMASEVVSNLPLGLLTSDLTGNVAMVNPPAKKLLNIEINGKDAPLLQNIPGLDWGAISAELAGQGRILDREITLAASDGKTLTVSLSAAAMRNEEGVFLGNLFILRDVSEMKRLQAEARRNDRLTALGNLAAGVAHEIRNPLSTIKGVATYIAKRMRPGGREEEAAMTMIAEVDRLNRVVSELLEFARPGAVTTVRSDLREVVNRALRLVEVDLKAKNITARVEGSPDFPLVSINQERFTQALLNLILNAVQAMESGGALTISFETLSGGEFSVSVSDTGPGVPENIQASIFTPYFTTKPSGTGLGLAIVHQIVEGHNGRIQVANIPGAGARFTIILPMDGKERERT